MESGEPLAAPVSGEHFSFEPLRAVHPPADELARREARDAQIVALAKAGRSRWAIARQLGIGPATVQIALRRHAEDIGFARQRQIEDDPND